MGLLGPCLMAETFRSRHVRRLFGVSHVQVRLRKRVNNGEKANAFAGRSRPASETRELCISAA